MADGVDSTTGTPGPILTVELNPQAHVEELRRQLAEHQQAIADYNVKIAQDARAALAGQASDAQSSVEALRQRLAAERGLIVSNNADISAAQRQMLGAQTDDLRDSLKDRIALLREHNNEELKLVQKTQEEIRRAQALSGADSRVDRTSAAAEATRMREEIRQAQQLVPKKPLDVNIISGASAEAFHLIREELGALLGPLNGVTGRLTAMASLFHTFAETVKQSAEHSAEAIKAFHSIIGIAGDKVQKFKISHDELWKSISNTSSTLGTSTGGWLNFGNIIDKLTGSHGRLSKATQGTGKETFVFDTELAKAAGTTAKLAAGTTESISVIGALGSIFSTILPIAAGVGAAIATVFGVLFESGKQVAETAEKYEAMGARIGATVKEVQGLSLVAASAGVPLEEMVQGLTRLSSALTGHAGPGQAGGGAGIEDGSGRVQRALKILIGTIRDSQGAFLKQPEVMKRVADQFKLLENGPVKSALAMEIFGREGAKLIPILNQGSAAIEDLMKQADEFGPNLDGQSEKMRKWNEAIGKVSLAWLAFKARLADVGVFDLVTRFLDGMSLSLKQLGDRFADFKGSSTFTQTGEALSTSIKEGIVKGSLTGNEAYTENSKKAIDEVSRYIETKIGKTRDLLGKQGEGGKFFVPDTGPKLDMLPPEAAERIKADISEIFTKAKAIEDTTTRTKFVHDQLALAFQKEANFGDLQYKQASELNALEKEHLEVRLRAEEAVQGGKDFDEYLKKVEESNKELDKSETKFKALAAASAAAFKPKTVAELTAEIASLTKKINDATTAAKEFNEARSSSTKEQRDAEKANEAEALKAAELRKQDEEDRNRATEKANEQAKRLASEKKRLIEESKALSDSILEGQSKELGAADRLAIAQERVKKINDDIAESLKTIVGIPAQRPYDAATKSAQGLKAATKAAHDELVKSSKQGLFSLPQTTLKQAVPGKVQSGFFPDQTQTGFNQAPKPYTPYIKESLPQVTSAAPITDLPARKGDTPEILAKKTDAMNAYKDAMRVADEQQAKLIAEDKKFDEETEARTAAIADLDKQISSGSLSDTALADASQKKARLEEENTRAVEAHKKAQEDIGLILYRSTQDYLGLNKALAENVRLNSVDMEALKNQNKNVKAKETAFGDERSAENTVRKEDADKKKVISDEEIATAKLAGENKKLDDELAHVNDKLGTLTQRFVAAREAVKRDTEELAHFNAVLAAVKANPDSGEKEKQTAEQNVINAKKKLLGDDQKLIEIEKQQQKEVFKLSEAWAAFNDILSGFGVKTPKVLQDMEKMIQGLQKLYKLITYLNATRGAKIDISGNASEFAGLGGSSGGGGFAGILRSALGLPSRPQQVNAAGDFVQTGGSGSFLQRVFGPSQLTGPAAGGQPLLGTAGAQNAQGIDVGAIPGIGFGGKALAGAPSLFSQSGAGAAAGPILGLAGAGAALGGAVGGTLGTVGGGIAGAAGGIALASSAGLIAVSAAVPIVGAIIGAALLVIGILHKRALAETAKIATRVQNEFKQTIDSFNAGDITLGAAITQAQSQRDAAFTRLSGKTGGWDQLTKIIPQLDDQINQLKKQQEQVLIGFNKDLGTLRFGEGIRSTISSITDLNQKLRDFVNAGGNANTAAEFLARSLAQIKTDTQTSLLNSEQGVVGLMLQELDLEKQKQDLIRQNATAATQTELSYVQAALQGIDLEQQRSDLIKSNAVAKLQQEKNVVDLLIQQKDLELQKANITRNAAEQIYNIENQGVISRSRSTAQNEASQILEIKRQRDLDLKNNNQQINLNKAQLSDQQKLFGLTGDYNTLLSQQVALQKQLTDLSLQQTAIDQQRALSNINYQITQNQATQQALKPYVPAGLPTDKAGLQQTAIDLQYKLDTQAQAQNVIDQQLALKNINDQIAGVKAQIGLQNQLFGLTYDRNALLATQLQIQTQLTNQQSQQLADTEKLLALLAKIAPGGTQIDLNQLLKDLGGAVQIPGLPQPTGTGGGIFDPTSFLLKASSEQFGQNLLQQVTGSKNPKTLTQAQEQAVIALAEAYKKQTADVKAFTQSLKDIYNGQLLLLQESQIPGGASGSFTAGTTSFTTAITTGGTAAATSIQNAMVAGAQTAATTIASAVAGITTSTGIPAQTAVVTSGAVAPSGPPSAAPTGPFLANTPLVSGGLTGTGTGPSIGGLTTTQVTAAVAQGVTTGTQEASKTVTTSTAPTGSDIQHLLPGTFTGTPAPFPPVQIFPNLPGTGSGGLFPTVDYPTGPGGAPLGQTTDTLPAPVASPVAPAAPSSGGGVLGTVGKIATGVGAVGTGLAVAGGVTGLSVASGGIAGAIGGAASGIGSTILGSVGGALGGVASAVGGAVSGVLGAIGSAVPILGTIGSAIGGALGSVGGAISGALGGILPAISGALGPIGLLVGGVVALLSHIFNGGPSKDAKNAAQGFVASVNDVVASFNSGAIQAQVALVKIQQLEVDAETRLGHDKANKPLLEGVTKAVAPVIAELTQRVGALPASSAPPSVPKTPLPTLTQLPRNTGDTGFLGGLFSGGGASTAAKNAAIGFGNGINSITAAFNAGTLKAADAVTQIQKIQSDAVARLGHDSGNKEWLANITNQVGPILAQLAQDMADAAKAAVPPSPPPAPIQSFPNQNNPKTVTTPGPPTDPITGLPITTPVVVPPAPTLPPQPVLGPSGATPKPEPCVPVDPGVFTAPFLPFLKASTKLIDIGTGGATGIPPFLTTPAIPSSTGPLFGGKGSDNNPVFGKGATTGGSGLGIVGGTIAETEANKQTAYNAALAGWSAAKSAAAGNPIHIPGTGFSNPFYSPEAILSGVTPITGPGPVLSNEHKLWGPTGHGPGLDLQHLLPKASVPTMPPPAQTFNMGGVNVNISGTSNMNRLELQRAVTDGMQEAFSTLRARRGVNQPYGA